MEPIEASETREAETRDRGGSSPARWYRGCGREARLAVEMSNISSSRLHWKSSCLREKRREGKAEMSGCLTKTLEFFKEPRSSRSLAEIQPHVDFRSWLPYSSKRIETDWMMELLLNRHKANSWLLAAYPKYLRTFDMDANAAYGMCQQCTAQSCASF